MTPYALDLVKDHANWMLSLLKTSLVSNNQTVSVKIPIHINLRDFATCHVPNFLQQLTKQFIGRDSLEKQNC